METYIPSETECRLRQLENDVMHLKRLEILRHIADEQGNFLRRNTLIVIGGMAALGVVFTVLVRFG